MDPFLGGFIASLATLLSMTTNGKCGEYTKKARCLTIIWSFWTEKITGTIA